MKKKENTSTPPVNREGNHPPFTEIGVKKLPITYPAIDQMLSRKKKPPQEYSLIEVKLPHVP